MSDFNKIKKFLKKQSKQEVEAEKPLVANDYNRQLYKLLDIQERFQDKETAAASYKMNRATSKTDFRVVKLVDDTKTNYIGKRLDIKPKKERIDLSVTTKNGGNTEFALKFSQIDDIIMLFSPIKFEIQTSLGDTFEIIPE